MPFAVVPRPTHIRLFSASPQQVTWSRDLSSASRKFQAPARVHWPDLASPGVEVLVSSAAPGPAMNGGLPGFRTLTHLSSLLFYFSFYKEKRLDFP